LLNFDIELNTVKEYLKKDSSNQTYISNALKNNSNKFFDQKNSQNSDNSEEILYLQLESIEKVNNNNNDQTKKNENQSNNNKNQNKSNSINMNFSEQKNTEITEKRKTTANNKSDTDISDSD